MSEKVPMIPGTFFSFQISSKQSSWEQNEKGGRVELIPFNKFMQKNKLTLISKYTPLHIPKNTYPTIKIILFGKQNVIHNWYNLIHSLRHEY